MPAAYRARVSRLGRRAYITTRLSKRIRLAVQIVNPSSSANRQAERFAVRRSIASFEPGSDRCFDRSGRNLAKMRVTILGCRAKRTRLDSRVQGRLD